MSPNAKLVVALTCLAGSALPAVASPFAQTAVGPCTQVDGYNTCRAVFAVVTGTQSFQIDYLGCELKGENAMLPPNLQASRLMLRTTLAGKPVALPVQVTNPTQALTRDAAYSVVSMPLSFSIGPNERLIIISESRTGAVTSITCSVVGKLL